MTKQPTFDANATSGKNFGDLPEWDLSDLYESTDAKELKRDMDWLEKACADFAADYEGKLATLDAAGLLPCGLCMGAWNEEVHIESLLINDFN